MCRSISRKFIGQRCIMCKAICACRCRCSGSAKEYGYILGRKTVLRAERKRQRKEAKENEKKRKREEEKDENFKEPHQQPSLAPTDISYAPQMEVAKKDNVESTKGELVPHGKKPKPSKQNVESIKESFLMERSQSYLRKLLRKEGLPKKIIDDKVIDELALTS